MPILRIEVHKQRKLKTLVPKLDTTNLTDDPALAVVGGSSKDADEAQPTRPKRKLMSEAVHIVCEELHRGGEVGPEYQRGALHGQIF